MTSQHTPTRLLHIQHWFASVITQPLSSNDTIRPIAPSGIPIAYEAAQYIAPSPTLTSSQRMEIYNQQYWWRLLDTMEESFPFLLRLFGKEDFNETIAIPYLARYPSQHWSLCRLGSRLLQWIRRYYRAADRSFVYAAASCDDAFNNSFTAAHNPPLQIEDLAAGEDVLQRPLYLQPHIFLFSFTQNIFSFRDLMLEHPAEHWINQEWPPLPQEKEPLAFMVWRDSMNTVGWIDLDPIEFLLLKKFQRGCSFVALCRWLEQQQHAVGELAARNLQEWCHRWTINEWLCV